MDYVTGNNSIRSLFLLSMLIIWKLYPFATFTDKTAKNRPLSPPHPHPYTLFLFNDILARNVTHLINVSTAVYSCTLFNTLHSLVNNNAHNYVSRVSIRIITRSVLILDILQMCQFFKPICQTNSLHQAVFLSC